MKTTNIDKAIAIGHEINDITKFQFYVKCGWKNLIVGWCSRLRRVILNVKTPDVDRFFVANERLTNEILNLVDMEKMALFDEIEEL